MSQREMYRSKALRTIFETVSPRSCALAMAARQRASETLMARGVSDIAFLLAEKEVGGVLFILTKGRVNVHAPLAHLIEVIDIHTITAAVSFLLNASNFDAIVKKVSSPSHSTGVLKNACGAHFVRERSDWGFGRKVHFVSSSGCPCIYRLSDKPSKSQAIFQESFGRVA